MTETARPEGKGSMDFETVSAADFGRSLTGLGVNLLSPDVRALAAFLSEVFGLSVHQLSDDFASVTHDGAMFKLHHDGTFRAHPVLGLVPETLLRGRRRRGTWCWSHPQTNPTGCANAPCSAPRATRFPRPCMRVEA